MRIASILDPIDPSFMAEGEHDRTDTPGGIRVSNSAIAILLFLFAQTMGAIWWASAINSQQLSLGEKIGTLNIAIAKQNTDQLDKIKELEQKIATLEVWNQQLRERLAARGLLDGKK